MYKKAVNEVSNSSKNQPESKTCRHCGQTKPLNDFARNSGLPDGHGIYCRSCFAVRYRAYREKKAAGEGREIRVRREVPDGYRWCPDCQTMKPLEEFPRNKSGRQGRGGYCKPCHNAKGKATYERLYGGTREYHLRRRYGLTSAEVNAMIEAQGGTCAVCTGPAQHVDHDHATGEVRGILCFNCNQALGNARDDVQVLRGLARYLELHQKPTLRLVVDQVRNSSESVFEVRLRKHLAS